jgi:hypothetical protein
MALMVERIVDGGVRAEEALGGSSRFEPLQFALSSSHRLMRILGPIVSPAPLFVRAAQPSLAERRGVRAQLVGDQQFRREALLLEKLAHQSQRRLAVAPALYQHVEHLALVIDGTPEIHLPTGNPDHHLVQMPPVTRPRATPAQPSGDRRAEFQHPTPHRFIGEVEPALGEQLLDVSVAQGEAEIEPDRVLDDLAGKAMAVIAERWHAATLTYEPPCAIPLA